MKRILVLSAIFVLLALSPVTVLAEIPAAVDFDLTDAPVIAVDWSKGHMQYITLHGNRRFTFSNGQYSAKYALIITQDATGSRIPVWPSSVRWPGGGQPPTLTTTANKTDYVTFFYNRRSNTYDMVGVSPNY
jgi:hypothetical protein